MEWLSAAFADFFMNDSFVLTSIVTLARVILCRGFLWKKDTWLRNLLEWVSLTVVLRFAFILNMNIFDGYNPIAWTILHELASLVYIYRCADCNKQAKFLLWCSMSTGICCLLTIAGQVCYLIEHFVGDPVLSNAVNIFCYLLMIPLAIYLRHFNFGNFKTFPKVGYLLVIAGDVGIFVLTAVEFLWMKTDYRIVTTLLAGVVCLFSLVLIIIFAIYTMCKEQSEIMELQAEKQRLQSERELTTITESTLEDLRCIRHDLKNQYAYIQLLLKGERYEDAMAYLQQMSVNMPPQLSYVDCGNHSVNTILNMEITKAKQADITVKHQLVVPPVLPFSNDDLCAVIANLMDNAIEECCRLKQAGRENVGLCVEIHPHKSYLFIMCSNDTDRVSLERNKNGLRTTKEDDQLHGYGTKIISKAAEKYNGCAEYSLENGMFVAKVILDMMMREEEA